MKNLLRETGRSVLLTLLFVVVCCIAYPLVVTGVAQVAFHDKANGSLVTDGHGNVTGSTLIGQCWYKTSTDAQGNVTFKTVQDQNGDDLYFEVDPQYFQGRPLWLWVNPKDTNGNPVLDKAGNPLQQLPQPAAGTSSVCNPSASGGSNLGPNNPTLINAVTAYTKYLHSLGVARNADGTDAPMPVDLVTGDFTGFDPDISEAAALAQVGMVANARHLDPAKVRLVVENHVEGRSLGIFGSPAVNVLALNQDLMNGAAG